MITFEQLGLDEELVKGITELGFETPTPIQAKAIPVLLSGTTDFVGLAQTGTGKTAAFGLPLLQLIDDKEKYPQALIICPTRELCVQINNDLMVYKKFKRQISSIAVYGGTAISTQISALKRGVQIVAATPGRLIDLIERKAIDLKKVKYVVLDEADEMLNMGFRDDIDFVLKNTPERESVWLFSATMPNEVRSIANRFMKSPEEVTIGKKNATNSDIDHQYFVTSAHQRYEALKRLIDFNPDIYGIIFTRTKAGAQEIADKLNREGYALEAIHGDLSQQQRDRVMHHFREKSIQILVATDVAARGIDVDGITHVINYELPDDPEVYTHRSGRTGRAGKKGICFSLCHSRELSRIRQIEALIKIPIHKMDIPDAKDVIRKQFSNFMDKLMAVEPNIDGMDQYFVETAEKFESVSKEDILKKVATLEMDHVFQYYKNAEDLNIKKLPGQRRNERNSSERGSSERGHSERRTYDRKANGYNRLFINVGTKDGFHKANFLQFILDESDLRKTSIGRIDMKDVNTWVEVENKDAVKMIKKLNGKKFKGRTIRMNEADSVLGKRSR